MGGVSTDIKLGTQVRDDGVSFGLWAPFADEVWVKGDFNDWSDAATPLSKNDAGVWTVDVPGARVGHEYKYKIRHGEQYLERNDPRALQLTGTGDVSIIVDPAFDWGDDTYRLPPIEKTIIYELHVGTFARNDPTMPGTFAMAEEKLDYLASLGINVIEVMPCNAVWMDRWWGYTPTNIYAVDAAYGGYRAFQRFVRAAHARGLGVILDVVYNHFSVDPGLDLWQFDGWSENDSGGIYFYNDNRGTTPWGVGGRPDFGRPEVRQFITDNAAMWLRDCRVDGLRVDSTTYIRTTEGRNNDPSNDLSDGWRIMQEITATAQRVKPSSLVVAEDLQGNAWITKPAQEGGAGFGAQWDPSLASILREVLDPPVDEVRDIDKIRFALTARTNDNPFERVIFSESHDFDALANGGTRLDETIEPGNAGGLYARRRSALAAALLMTTPGVPMLFQGQEFQQDGGFTHYASLDWENIQRFSGILELYKHLIALRLNRHNNTAGLLGPHVDVAHINTEAKLVAYHRWDKAGAGDDVVVIANFANQLRKDYEIAFPDTGTWWVRLNTDWSGYSADFTDAGGASVAAAKHPNDAQKFVGRVDIAPYSVLILSKDK